MKELIAGIMMEAGFNMTFTNATEIANICARTFTNIQSAREYCERIAAQDGPLSRDYAAAAIILAGRIR